MFFFGKYSFPSIKLTWRHFVVHFSSSFWVRISGICGVTVSFKVSFMVRISFLFRGKVSICDFVMKFVDKLTSCQFGSWKQVADHKFVLLAAHQFEGTGTKYSEKTLKIPSQKS